MPDSAFVLHRYPYKETSLLLKVFTREQGLISLIIKGAKKKNSDAYSMLQCFQPLAIDYALKGELGNLKQVERQGRAPVLQNEALYSAFYVNELLLFLLPPHESFPALFDLYVQTLQQLPEHLELSLRLFELNLLRHLGFLPELHRDDEGRQISVASQYLITPGHLPRLLSDNVDVIPSYVFLGRDLKDFSQGTWTLESLKTAKRLCRIFIEQHTRGKIFKSRELFMATKEFAIDS